MVAASEKALAGRVVIACQRQGLRLVTAESCTGGLVSAALTSIAGASSVLERGFVTYSNQAKIDLLGVPARLIAEHGAVSEQAVQSMAEGALAVSEADLSIAITGIAGPGGSEAKPEGLVYFACARKNDSVYHEFREFGSLGRNEIRRKSVQHALTMLLDIMENRVV